MICSISLQWNGESVAFVGNLGTNKKKITLHCCLGNIRNLKPSMKHLGHHFKKKIDCQLRQKKTQTKNSHDYLCDLVII